MKAKIQKLNMTYASHNVRFFEQKTLKDRLERHLDAMNSICHLEDKYVFKEHMQALENDWRLENDFADKKLLNISHKFMTLIWEAKDELSEMLEMSKPICEQIRTTIEVIRDFQQGESECHGFHATRSRFDK